MPRQYVACKFRASDTRSYTYHYDGDDTLVPGDEVKVEDNRSDGWKRVYVCDVNDDAPPFDTKPILGKIDLPDGPNPLFPDGIAEQ
ncbi:hypothetical protein [Novosphingobium sp. KN65.2]|uniref:hypothetical protein n=1 Tax=Novosphingobium sp. KN65.2 TaxID=1478134 RepID=UPI0005E49BB6|nr:hypothetical protein [Novosphingobium sp. KN65.2]CDO37623.1 hypothetical protein SPHV1_370010 [Novosphingobium sp. KN65.2]